MTQSVILSVVDLSAKSKDLKKYNIIKKFHNSGIFLFFARDVLSTEAKTKGGAKVFFVDSTPPTKFLLDHTISWYNLSNTL